MAVPMTAEAAEDFVRRGLVARALQSAQLTPFVVRPRLVHTPPLLAASQRPPTETLEPFWMKNVEFAPNAKCPRLPERRNPARYTMSAPPEKERRCSKVYRTVSGLG